MSTMTKKITVECMDCEQQIKLSFEPVLGQIITCPHCEAEFEVIALNPVELDWAFFDLEDEDDDLDWDEDDDDDYDDDDDDD